MKPVVSLFVALLVLIPANVLLAERVEGYSYIEIPYELHPDHTLWGIPAMPPSDNDLIFRRAYTLLSNDRTKFADWVAFVLTADMLGKKSPDR